MVNGLVVKAVGAVATGLVGAAAYDAVKRLVRSEAIRGATVKATAWGLRGVRAAEASAEKVRLVTADVVSEARAQIGEEAPAPGGSKGRGHKH